MSEGAAEGGRRAVESARATYDACLIARFRAGQTHALDELLLRYDQPVRRILASFDVASCDLDDLTQEVFIRVFRNLQYFRAQSSFSTWLYRVAVNVRLDDVRTRKREVLRLDRLQRNARDLSTDRDRSMDPYSAFESASVRDALIKAVDALPVAFKAVVMMRTFDALSYGEIAACTDMSIGAVRSRLARARTRLRQLLRPWELRVSREVIVERLPACVPAGNGY